MTLGRRPDPGPIFGRKPDPDPTIPDIRIRNSGKKLNPDLIKVLFKFSLPIFYEKDCRKTGSGCELFKKRIRKPDSGAENVKI